MNTTTLIPTSPAVCPSWCRDHIGPNEHDDGHMHRSGQLSRLEVTDGYQIAVGIEQFADPEAGEVFPANIWIDHNGPTAGFHRIEMLAVDDALALAQMIVEAYMTVSAESR